MKVIDSITFRCIVHATEELEKVKKAFLFVTGMDSPEVTRTHGYHGNDIFLLSLTMTKSREFVRFWRRMKEFGVVDEIQNNLDELVDDAGYLHLRFDKQEAYRGNIAISHGGDTIVMKMKILSYPWRKDKAIKNLIEFFNSI
ncbi:MAG: exosome subunit [Euryarchaeota archaeon]|nr:exosome subunit [Euryarchaeota archaeon]